MTTIPTAKTLGPTSLDLPVPTAEGLNYSQQLLLHIRDVIQQHADKINFAQYMELALYAPGLGYYSAGSQKFGAAGDFVTAPEISPLFSRSVAKQCQQVLKAIDEASILEFGAGSGMMAADLLLELEAQACLPKQYLILEPSAELQARQQATLRERVPHLLSYCSWITSLPEANFTGIIVANEVLDAMPVRRFQIREQDIFEYYVTWENNALQWNLVAVKDKQVYQQLRNLQQQYFPTAAYYEVELNFYLAGWLKSVSQFLNKGMVLIIDYGFPRHEFYHPDRYQGTLMCHYRHRAHADPLILTGLQDITTHVDFTAIAEHADAVGFEIAGYTAQAAFLLSCGITDLAADMDKDAHQQLMISQQLNQLLMPHEMGELFKVMALTKNLQLPLFGFSLHDQRGRL